MQNHNPECIPTMTRPPQNLSRISNFVTLALVTSLGELLSSEISIQIGAEARTGQSDKTWAGWLPSFCLSSALGAAVATCSSNRIQDETSFEDALHDIRHQFEVVNDCPVPERRQALDILEHVYDLATDRAHLALQEALSGFPISGGDFGTWKEAELQRAMQSLSSSTSLPRPRANAPAGF